MLPPKMPDLSDLDPALTINRVLNSLGSRGLYDFPVGPLAANLVRVVDNAVREYGSARVALIEAYADHFDLGFFGLLARAVSHLETCVESAYRGILFTIALRKRGLCLPDGTPVVPREAELEVVARPAQEKLREFRGAIQHGDQRIRILEKDTGGPYTLLPRRYVMKLLDEEIAYEDLARWLRQLHAVGVRVNNCGRRTLIVKPQKGRDGRRSRK